MTGGRMRWGAALLAGAVLATGCGGVVEVAPVGSVALDPPQQTSTIVAADGTVLAQLHAEQDRELVPLDEIPRVLRDAVVAVEDARFYDHAGVDARAVARALVRNARSGEVVEGGSTITQQLAKNVVVGSERTLERKLEEAGVALRLEHQFSKHEILERYLNTVYFGHGAYGVQTAARRYFDVDVAALTLPQAALLAALLKAPSAYDPYRAPDAATARRNLVVRLMRERGLVSAPAARAAQASGLGVVPPPQRDRWEAPYFVDHVLDRLQHDAAFDVLGEDSAARANALFRGGLRVETTLDRQWQAAAHEAIARTLTAPDDPAGALVAIDPATGGIRALVGGRDYDDPSDPTARFNLATDARRQPGSTFKQLVLATALAQGHSLDETFPGGRRVVVPPRPGEPYPYPVRNYDNLDFGRVSLREATAFSVNVVYARLIAAVGPEAVVETARAAGIRSELAPVRSLALGTSEVSPLEMASVQATLAAGGVYRRPTVVTRVTGPGGEVLYERPQPRGKRVLDEGVAWLTTQALRDVVDAGTGARAGLHRPLAGKTGTTQNGVDAWFVGYTPELAAAVWMGFPRAAVPMVPPRTRIRVEGGNWPAEAFARFALRALDDVPASDFAKPDLDLVTVEVDVTRNCLPNPYTPPDVVAQRSYLRGTAPTAVCTEPTGPPSDDVPSVVGLPLRAAVRLLRGSGYTVERAAEHSRTLPPGYITRQERSQ
ncbi:MAG: PBP1A family penicillin-binding protein, partial [Actinomycetota bacterium]|nr:PBP1A family penicillin-binding protein [Actinomycetota bacterium]